MNQENVVSPSRPTDKCIIQVTNPLSPNQCTLSEMLETVDTQLELCLYGEEKFLKSIIIDFVGLAPHFFECRHTVGEKPECDIVVEPLIAEDDMPPEIPALAKTCGMIKEDVKLDFKKGTVRTRKSPRHAKDNQLGMWSLTPNEARDDWIISVEVPGWMEFAQLTFSDVFTSSPNNASSPAITPTLLTPLPSLSSIPSFSRTTSTESASPMPFLLVPALSTHSSMSLCDSELDSDCSYSMEEFNMLEAYHCYE